MLGDNAYILAAALLILDSYILYLIFSSIVIIILYPSFSKYFQMRKEFLFKELHQRSKANIAPL